MKIKKSIIVTVAVSCAGLVALALSGCEWFDFPDKNAPKNISGTLGYDNNTASWLTSPMDSNRYDAYQSYLSAIEAGAIDPDVSFMDYLKATSDDSSALASGLRASVAIVAQVSASSPTASLGSGVIYSLKEDADGGLNAYVITNYHVIYSSEQRRFCETVYTFLYGDKYGTAEVADAMTATYIGGSAQQDIAVLSVEIPEEKAEFVQALDTNIEIRNSDHANAGEKVYAIGNLLGGGISVVSGVVSVEAEYNTFANPANASQSLDMLTMRIDAPVNHGNSGGGLFDASGRFLGIVNGGSEVRVRTDDGYETIAIDGYGFAIPANRALSVAQSIIDNAEEGKKAAYYGLLGTFETVSSRGQFNSLTQTVDIIEKVSVAKVESGSPFSKEIVGKILTNITVKDSEDKETVNCDIVRRHQAETVLFNIRMGDKVTLTFDDGSFVEATYSRVNQFGQTG